MIISMVYIPIIGILIFSIQYRQRFSFIDTFIQSLPLKATAWYEQVLIYGGSAIFTLLWGSLIAFVVFPSSDVIQAMTSGINAFWAGENPFVANVVPHMVALPSGPGVIYGTYNYGPLDLIIYGIGYLIFKGLLGELWWIVGFNYILVFIIYAIFRQTFPEVPDIIKFPPFMIIMGCFLQDNVILMIAFLAGAWWAYERLTNPYKDVITVLLLSAGVLTKMFVLFVLMGYFIYVFQKEIRKWFLYSLLVGCVELFIMLPFNILAVIHSVFFFNTDFADIAQYAVIQGSIPAVLQILGIGILFVPIAIILTGVFIIVVWYYSPDNLYLEMIVFTLLALSLLPNTVYAFFAIPFYFCLILYNSNYQHGLSEEKLSLNHNDLLKGYPSKTITEGT